MNLSSPPKADRPACRQAEIFTSLWLACWGHNSKFKKYIVGWLSFNGRTMVCGTMNEGSIPSSHPSVYFKKIPPKGIFVSKILKGPQDFSWSPHSPGCCDFVGVSWPLTSSERWVRGDHSHVNPFRFGSTRPAGQSAALPIGRLLIRQLLMLTDSVSTDAFSVFSSSNAAIT